MNVPNKLISSVCNVGTGAFLFSAMEDRIHIDEKWFNIYKGHVKLYLLNDEQVPYQSTVNKSFIAKNDVFSRGGTSQIRPTP